MDSFRVSAPFLKLKCNSAFGKSLSCIATDNFIVVYYDKAACVFSLKTPTEKTIYTFTEHRGTISGMLQVADDVVASLGEDGVLLTWSAETGQVIDEFKVPGASFASLSKHSPTMLVLCARESAPSASKPIPKQQVEKKSPPVYDDDDDDDSSLEFVHSRRAGSPTPTQDIKPNIMKRPPLRKKPAVPAVPAFCVATAQVGRNSQLEKPRTQTNVYFITHYAGRHLSKMRSLDGWAVPGVISGHLDILVFNSLVYNAHTGKKISDLKPSSIVRCSAVDHDIIVIGCNDCNVFFYANQAGYKQIGMSNCNDFFGSSSKGAVTGVEIVDSKTIIIGTEVRGVLFVAPREGGGYEVVGQIVDASVSMTHGFKNAAMMKKKDIRKVSQDETQEETWRSNEELEELKREAKKLKTELGIQKIWTRKLETEITAQKLNMEKIEAIYAANFEQSNSELSQLKRAMENGEDKGARSSM